MATKEQVKVGDLVSLITFPAHNPTYAANRKIGVVTEIAGPNMYYVKWVSSKVAPCWYQRRALIKLNNQKNKNNYLTDVA
jgi:hypothetical protein